MTTKAKWKNVLPVMAAIKTLTPEERSRLIDDVLELYCSMCAEPLDADGECPDGCDPSELLGEDEETEHEHAH